MPGKIAFAVCENYGKEAIEALMAEGAGDAVAIVFPARCGRPPLTGDELAALIRQRDDVEQVEVFGASCLAGLTDSSFSGCPLHVHKMANCFSLLVEPSLLDRYLEKGAYLATPGWLAHWPARMELLGLDRETARELFAETTSTIVLLDTGNDEKSNQNLKAFARHVDRPWEIRPTGVAMLRLLFLRIFLSRQRADQDSRAAGEIKELREQTATYAMAMDLIANLARIVNEEQAVAAMLDVYLSLFAPRRICYLSFNDGLPDRLRIRPEGSITEEEMEEIKSKLAVVSQDSGYTESGRGFILRIARRGEIWGVIAVEEIAFPEYRERYLNLALSLADICELPVENARKYEKIVRTEALLKKANAELYHLSTTDALTGIANRRAYDEQMEVEWKRAQRSDKPLSLIVCDIDFFKKFNDRYGHEAGDACLHAVAQIIRQAALRPGDFAARYGGEEFAVILPDTEAEGALKIAERIRTAVMRQGIPHEDSEVAAVVTLSIGVSSTAASGAARLSPAVLFRMADAALYEAKRQGRNRAVLQVRERDAV